MLDGIRVIVVDDDPDSVDIFSMALMACGAQAMTFDNARDALAAAIDEVPDIIVSDISMEREDGYWLVRSLRTHPRTTAMPVIAATAYGHEHPRDRVIGSGFTERLQKPVDIEELCGLVASLTGR